MKNFYSQFMTTDDITFDVGANFGSRTEIFAELSKQVVAVEPQKRCMEGLKSYYGENPKVKLVHKALGSCEGSTEMSTCEIVHGISSLSPA